MSIDTSDSTVIDVPALLNHVGNDTEMVHELLDIFNDYYPDQRYSLKTAIDQKDSANVREIAHTLKGALANFHAVGARDVARDLEFAGRDENVDSFSELYIELDRRVQEAITCLAAI